VTSGLYSGESAHDGAIVAAGYRFIPGLFGYGNTVDRWQNVNSTDHNEYYGSTATAVGAGAGCGVCHQEGTAGTDALGNPVGGFSSRAATTSYLKVPNNSMSGFCATCHGVFHSMGSENGTSGAFLRHPSDWVIPASGEYAAYTSYDITAPVARPTVYTAASGTVTPGTDMVMCLSCHEAHATQYDFMLRFNYGTYTGADGLYDGSGTMDAGAYGSIGAATAQGGCLACHTTKGVLPENR